MLRLLQYLHSRIKFIDGGSIGLGIMFDLFLGLFNLLVPKLYRVLLLLNLLDCLLKLALNLIETAKLMFKFVFFLGDFLDLLHEGSVLFR